jgi:PAS domain S-box-containing protein
MADSMSLLAALPVAVYTTDAQGRITYFNEAAAELWGCRPELGKSEFCGSWKLYWPDGTPLPHDECPMALALKQRRPIHGMEAIAERPDGTRVPFIPYPTPLFDADGVLTGAINMLVDISQHRRAEQAAQQLAAIITSSDDAIVSKNLDGIIQSWNGGAQRLFGYSPEEVIGKSIMILIPKDRQDEEPKIIERIRRGERVDHYEPVRRRKDGTLIDISLTVSPVRDGEGRIVGASKIARDITDRKRAQEQQKLLLREMSHRVKNLFAVTSGLVTLSARSANTPHDMAAAVRGRLAALTRAHELTRPGLIGGMDVAEQTTTLHALIRTIFAPYVNGHSGGRESVVVDGSDVPIGGSAVTNLALLLHELTTNAAKYGALSSADGVVHVGCTLQNGELVLTWKELGGPPIEAEPDNEGFGGLLARQLVSAHFGGTLARNWMRDGLVARLSVPADRLGN